MRWASTSDGDAGRTASRLGRAADLLPPPPLPSRESTKAASYPKSTMGDAFVFTVIVLVCAPVVGIVIDSPPLPFVPVRLRVFA